MNNWLRGGDMKKFTSQKAIFNYFSSVIFFAIGFFLFCHFCSGDSLDVHAADVDIIVPPIAVQVPTKLEARDFFLPIAEELWTAKIDKTKGLLVHQHGELLPAGTIVKPSSIMGDVVADEMVCDNESWLFFIDEAPGAHFGHPVRIVIVDKVTGVQKSIKADMWPVVEQSGSEKKSLFSTFSERNNVESIILEKHSILGPNSLNIPDLQTSPPLPIPFLEDDCCDAWAILVCGYDDLPDTFDDDTNGMYAALKNLGITDDHIFYLSPHTSHAGVDLPTTNPNVQWAINEVALRSGPKDKVLFLYSSHGGIDGLSCVPNLPSPDGDGISSSSLDSWLDAITSAELTIIIEACHSGSFIGSYADGTYVQAEDELTGLGETKRAVFTSASTDTSSYPDRDDPGDPNPSDVGSETIWGYIEALGVPSADTDMDGAVSFSEAYQYAWDNDVTRILGWNTPQMRYVDLYIEELFHHCYPVCDANGPYILNCEDGLTEVSLDGTSSDDPAPCDGFAYFWETDCPGAWFDDPLSPTPLLSNLTPVNGALECNASLTVSCFDGNSEECSAPVIISDTHAPIIACPVDIEIECHEASTPDNTGSASATDSCDPSPEIVFADQVTPGSCPDSSTIARSWEVNDGSGNTDSCTQTISVVDNTPPDITCNAPNTIIPPDAPVSFTATATDNCADDLTVEITNYDCFVYTKKGKRVDKTESCLVEISNDQITILDSGGVGDKITWVVQSTDDCGNSSTLDCEVDVVNPAR